jgi:hypothetical protein
MADFYPYLISSLPMLHFGMKPPFSFERFLDICCPFIPEKDFQVLRTLPQPQHYFENGDRHKVIRKWIEFDGNLRAELARMRAIKKHLDPAKFQRSDGYNGPSLVPVITGANVTATVLEAEKTLDEIRWKALDELATGHYFDLYVLITYACKLLILQRWENIRSADRTMLIKRALQH